MRDIGFSPGLELGSQKWEAINFNQLDPTKLGVGQLIVGMSTLQHLNMLEFGVRLRLEEPEEVSPERRPLLLQDYEEFDKRPWTNRMRTCNYLPVGSHVFRDEELPATLDDLQALIFSFDLRRVPVRQGSKLEPTLIPDAAGFTVMFVRTFQSSSSGYGQAKKVTKALQIREAFYWDKGAEYKSPRVHRLFGGSLISAARPPTENEPSRGSSYPLRMARFVVDLVKLNGIRPVRP